MYPHQKHKSPKAGKKASTDKSKSWNSSGRSKKGPQQAGSMTNQMAGTPVVAPGGRKSRAKGSPEYK